MFKQLKNIVKKNNCSVNVHIPLLTLIELMNLNNKGVIIVLEENRPVGILTERDIVKILYDGISLNEPSGEHARKSLLTANGDRTIGYALNLTLENNIRRVVVIDSVDNFLGVISQQDLLKYIEEEYSRADLLVKHVLGESRSLISVCPETSLHEVLKILIENKISSVPVIQDGKAVGIITEKDVLRIPLEDIPLENKVAEYMSAPVISATVETTISSIIKIMDFHHVRRVIITDKNENAVDMVTIRDVLGNLELDYTKFLERKLRNAKDVLNLIPEMFVEVIDTGDEHLIVWANEKVINIFGKGILDKTVLKFIPEEIWREIYKELIRVHKVENVMLEVRNEMYELSGYYIKTDGAEERGRAHLIIRDITENYRLSTTDALTGLYNRRFINEFLTNEIERSRRLGKEFSAVITDIDNFKTVNDTYGHLAGDLVLKFVARCIKRNLRKVDVVGRYGGDELIIVMPEISSGLAFHAIDRIRLEIQDSLVPLPENINVKVTGSFGLATFPSDGGTPDGLLIKADEMLYKAKKEGKNRVACISVKS